MASDQYDTWATIRLLHTYVRPGRRYAKLMGSWVALPPPQLRRFQRRLRRAALRAPVSDLDQLLALGWRERLTAAWLAGIARHTELRDKIGQLLLASETPHAGGGYCIALALFGEQDDADLLIAYLDRWLPRTDCRYDQADAIGALLHIDSQLRTHNADRFLAPGGLWQQWAQNDDTADPAELRWFTDQRCILADGGTPNRQPPDASPDTRT